MNKYGVYQFFLDKQGKERNLLVGFVEGKNEQEAKNRFTDSEFLLGFLTLIKCSDSDYKKKDLLKAIEENKNRLGVWNEH